MDTLEYDIQYNTPNEPYSDHPSILVYSLIMKHFYINFPAFLPVVFSFPALDKLLQSTHEQDFRQSP